MNLSTIFGILLGFVAILGSFFWEGGSPTTLFLLPAITIVIGGTLAAGITGSSMQMVKRIPQIIGITIFKKDDDWLKILDNIIKLASQSRKFGLLSIEDNVGKIENNFMRKMFQSVIDGVDNKNLLSIAEIEINSMTERHNENISFFTKLGGYSPTMGIIGTVMGLIGTFTSTGGDPNQLIHHIATAFIATLWGIFMANIVWLPLADKLRFLHDKEIRLNHFILIGISGIQTGDNPSMIMSKLSASFPASEQLQIVNRLKKIKEQELEDIRNAAAMANIENNEVIVGNEI